MSDYYVSDGDYYDSDVDYPVFNGYDSDGDYPVATGYDSDEYKEDSVFEVAPEVEEVRLVADFDQIQMTSSTFGNLGTKIQAGEYDRKAGNYRKLLQKLNIISASPEQRFEVLLLQDMRDFKGKIPEKFFNFIGALIQAGKIPNYGRYNPLAITLGMMVLDDDKNISEVSLKKVKGIIEGIETVSIPAVIKYARWWKNFNEIHPFRKP